MLMLIHREREDAKAGNKDGGCISWTHDGHAFVIRNRNKFVEGPLKNFFREAKFSSFTRKLYRWGFRQICIPKGHNKKERNMIFGHEHFQRADTSLMANMRSVTAAGTRRAIAALSARKKAKLLEESQPAPVKSPSEVIEARQPHDPCSLERPSMTQGLPITSEGQRSKKAPANLALSGLVPSEPSASLTQAALSAMQGHEAALNMNVFPRISLLNNNQTALLSPLQALQSQAGTVMLQNQLNYLKALVQVNSLSAGLLQGMGYTSQPSSNSTEALVADLQKLQKLAAAKNATRSAANPLI